MAEELEDRKTVMTPQEMADALTQAWWRYYGSGPSRESILVLLAHWALETGAGGAMHNYNLGNVKARPDGQYDYQYFACGERIKADSARKLLAQAAPGTMRIQSFTKDGYAWVWFYPKHPGCCFRAFKTLEAGVFDHLVMLINHKGFSQAWPAVLSGNVPEFSRRLRAASYYTAEETLYTATAVRWFSIFSKSIVIPDPPAFSSDQEREDRNALTFSLRRMTEEGMESLRRFSDDSDETT